MGQPIILRVAAVREARTLEFPNRFRKYVLPAVHTRFSGYSLTINARNCQPPCRILKSNREAESRKLRAESRKALKAEKLKAEKLKAEKLKAEKLKAEKLKAAS